jgi:hypothetical protein
VHVPGAEGTAATTLPPPERRQQVTRQRHSDAQLLDLATQGSAPAFAALLHRRRGELQRVVLDAADPRSTAEATMVSAIRELRRRRVTAETDVTSWIVELARTQAARTPSPDEVDQLLAPDWFDRAWSRAERAWPTGYARPRLPRWGALVLGALALAVMASISTYLYMSYEATTEIVGELVAEPLGPGEGLLPAEDVAPTADEPVPAPELFGDIEIGELPTYDLTGRGDDEPPVVEIRPPVSGAPDPDDAAGADGPPSGADRTP